MVLETPREMVSVATGVESAKIWRLKLAPGSRVSSLSPKVPVSCV